LPDEKGNMKEQKLNNKKTQTNPEITEGQVDCLVINFLAVIWQK